MFIIKKNYYLYIDNTKSINLDLLKNSHNLIIIFKNTFWSENIQKIILFKKKCDRKKIKFYIANNYNLAKKCSAYGLYLSSYNKKIYKNISTIGSAHNYAQIYHKIKQGCEKVIFSRLFKTNYKNKNRMLHNLRKTEEKCSHLNAPILCLLKPAITPDSTAKR